MSPCESDDESGCCCPGGTSLQAIRDNNQWFLSDCGVTILAIPSLILLGILLVSDESQVVEDRPYILASASLLLVVSVFVCIYVAKRLGLPCCLSGRYSQPGVNNESEERILLLPVWHKPSNNYATIITNTTTSPELLRSTKTTTIQPCNNNNLMHHHQQEYNNRNTTPQRTVGGDKQQQCNDNNTTVRMSDNSSGNNRMVTSTAASTGGRQHYTSNHNNTSATSNFTTPATTMRNNNATGNNTASNYTNNATAANAGGCGRQHNTGTNNNTPPTINNMTTTELSNNMTPRINHQPISTTTVALLDLSCLELAAACQINRLLLLEDLSGGVHVTTNNRNKNVRRSNESCVEQVGCYQNLRPQADNG